MSAFVVSKEHIDLLVHTAFTGPRPEPGSRRHWYRASWLKQKNLMPDDVGRMLLAENVASVSHLYRDTPADELPGPHPPYWLVSEAGEGGYRFTRQPYRLTAVEGLSALHCYVYQSCEHEAWDSSDTHSFCCSLRDALIAMLPGMEAAPWSWDAPAIAQALASSNRLSDMAVLDRIAALLDGEVWSPDTIMNVADFVRASGREVGDVPDDDIDPEA